VVECKFGKEERTCIGVSVSATGGTRLFFLLISACKRRLLLIGVLFLSNSTMRCAFVVWSRRRVVVVGIIMIDVTLWF